MATQAHLRAPKPKAVTVCHDGQHGPLEIFYYKCRELTTRVLSGAISSLWSYPQGACPT